MTHRNEVFLVVVSLHLAKFIRIKEAKSDLTDDLQSNLPQTLARYYLECKCVLYVHPEACRTSIAVSTSPLSALLHTEFTVAHSVTLPSMSSSSIFSLSDSRINDRASSDNSLNPWLLNTSCLKHTAPLSYSNKAVIH